MRAILIAGTHSGVGKTTVAAAAIAGLRARGVRVAAFKTGPDFLDPFHLAAAAGSACRTVDPWMLGRDGCAVALARAAASADIAVIEGMMGLFDGRTGASDEGSSAELARWFELPVVLVADASAGVRSLAATTLGFARFDPRVKLAGVVFNRIGGDGHLAMLREAMRELPGVAVLGGCPTDDGLHVPERHLGLALPTAPGPSEAWAEQHLDLNLFLTLAVELALPALQLPAAPPAPRLRMAVARDEAFCFYYPDNLELLRAAGFDLVEFSPLRDAALPAGTHAIYFGGGYPELHREALAANRLMLAAVRAFAAAGGFIYAECGGLMYLAESLDGAPMAGVVPAAIEMQPRLQAIGYREVEVAAMGGLRARGHEFHHSRILRRAEAPPAHYVLGVGGSRIPEGFAQNNVVASYIHLHFASCPELPRRMSLAAARSGIVRAVS
jgi:cobyrinic acid a,c-diamide synthase